MAFLAKGKKIDLYNLALELGLDATPEDKIIVLHDKITKSAFFAENKQFVTDTFNNIIDERKKLEENRKKLEEETLKTEKLAKERAFELEKLKLQNLNLSNSNQTDSIPKRFDLQTVLPTFRPETDDISLFLTMFERQMKLLNVSNDYWVSYLMGVLPSERGVQTVAKGIWIILEPFLFALIGAEVTFETLQNSAGFGALSILCGLSFRCFITYFVCSGGGFEYKEKIFIVVSWISKATLQAAIGSQALDFARQHDLDETLIQHGTTVLNVSVLSIVITAPLGAILISLLGPVLLNQDVIPSDSDEHFEQEDPDAIQTEEQSSAVLVQKDK